MDLIADNLTMTDCVIVATHNALALAGKPRSYKGIKSFCTKKGWYEEGRGFHNVFLNDLFKHYKLNCVPVKPGTTAKCLAKKVRTGTSYFLLVEPIYGGTGHAMVATKGVKGVKIINSNSPPYGGWRTLCKDIKQKYISICAFEIKGLYE